MKAIKRLAISPQQANERLANTYQIYRLKSVLLVICVLAIYIRQNSKQM